MRQSVMLNGVQISRVQYDELTKKFQEPEFKDGDVCWSSILGPVVLVRSTDPWLSDNARTLCHQENMVLILKSTGVLDGMCPTSLERVGTLSEIVAFYRQHHQEGK